ncbi:MAG: EAL domain-containing protein [Lachnospiraceae bacterium]|nr:EAL domain-containing protein [Lachnospiraceae bacterium]
MFTWNFHYVSKARLTETLNQLMLNSQKGDVLIRIHTAIHYEEEAVELAKYVKSLVPNAHIIGTSTAAVIRWGKIDPNQCVISVTQMDDCQVRSALLPTHSGGKQKRPLKPETLCKKVKEAVFSEDSKLMLAFLTADYGDVARFVEKSNDAFPGVPMIGGVPGRSELIREKQFLGYVFNENGWSRESILVASISGKDLKSCAAFATGVQAIGEVMKVTETDGRRIVSIDGVDAATKYLAVAREEDKFRWDLTSLLPFAYSDRNNVPLQFRFVRDQLYANHNVIAGSKIRRALIYDQKIMADNRAMFRRVENFEYAETIFCYSSTARYMGFPNSAKWEISVYENSNACGCLTDGIIVCADGRNVFANCSFALAACGEKKDVQEYHPYVFSNVEPLAEDNQRLLNYLVELEERLEDSKNLPDDNELRRFLRDCGSKLLYSGNEDLPNEAALNVDINFKGYDRICVISVLDIINMKLVFSEQTIQLTYKNYVEKCKNFAKEKNYRFYVLDQWQVAIGAPSYMISLADFTKDMECLYKKLFETSEEYVAIIPVVCILYNCTVDNLSSAYNSARAEMMNKNVQFLVHDANEGQMDADSIRKKYQMVNVINYALSHDALIPYYQGVFDNRKQTIHHYEALMRLADENGKIYYPGDFLEVARSYGLMYDQLSFTMIKKVFEQFKDVEGKSVSINIGMRDVKNQEIVDYIYDFLSTTRHPENFTFELLENEDVGDYGILLNFVDKIHELGGMISIDDFGSGYSNLQHVLSIQCDFIKIDGSIVRNCCVDKDAENLIALITGWKNLSSRNVKIVAEFVENEEIQSKLTIYDVDFSQGYLFSKPSPSIDEVAAKKAKKR